MVDVSRNGLASFSPTADPTGSYLSLLPFSMDPGFHVVEGRFNRILLTLTPSNWQVYTLKMKFTLRNSCQIPREKTFI